MGISRNIFAGSLAIVIATTLSSFDMPAGWSKTGSKSKSYDIGIDKGSGRNGGNAATIKSVDKKIDGFGALMQSSSPEKYLGKRVRMSGFVKTKDVMNFSGLWLRVDQASAKPPLAFDNMSDRPIKGTTDCKKYEIVLDVPHNASKIGYGILLNGTGQVWLDDLDFEIVDSTIATTGRVMENKEPVNLNFEK